MNVVEAVKNISHDVGEALLRKYGEFRDERQYAVAEYYRTIRIAVFPILVRMASQKMQQQRRVIRNNFLVADVETIRTAMENWPTEPHNDEFGRMCLQEMIDECERFGVNSFGELPSSVRTPASVSTSHPTRPLQ